jgi:hypothetical protein
MTRLEEIREFINDKQESLREEIAFFGRNPQTQEEKLAVAIYSSQLALLDDLQKIASPE